MSTTVARRCVGRRKNGEPCRKPPRRGQDTCQAHGDQPKGRPGKFTAATRDKVLAALRTGVWNKEAAIYAGVSEALLREWLALGRRYRDQGVENDFTDFLAGCEAAQVGLKVFVLGSLVAAAKKDWRAAAFIAERKWPDEYSLRHATPTEHAAETGLAEALGDRQPASLSRAVREQIAEIIAADEQDTIDGTAEDEAA